MSENIRCYRTMKGTGGEPKDMIITAFVGSGLDKNNPRRTNIQISIGREYCCLTESQLLDLIATIANRLNYRQEYTATGYTAKKFIIETDGTLTGGDYYSPEIGDKIKVIKIKERR